jgi:poly-gamma-glutamate capsule biosynthesis protein CapA/YwtB (metallophosphatase superfamily)
MLRRGALAPIALLLAAAAACGGGSGAGSDSAPAAAPARPVAPAAPAPKPVDLTIEVNGDLLIHSPVWLRARSLAGGRGYAFAPLLREVRPWIARADLALCHVETPMSDAPPRGYPVFNTPTALARAIRRTGWDACDTASNHTLDGGQRGVDATIRALDRAGVAHTGSAARARGARRIVMLRARGVRVAYLAYTTITNGIPRPHPWSVNLASPGRILRDARRARRAGAQVVLVNLHWGTEYQHAPSAAQLALARRLARSRAITAIVGQHVHVVQPIRRVRGRWVVFGEGNLLSNQTAACCASGSQDGILVVLHVRVRGTHSRVVKVDYVPTWVRHPDYTVLPVGRALRRGQAPAAELRASWARTVGVVGRRPGLRPVPRRLAG